MACRTLLLHSSLHLSDHRLWTPPTFALPACRLRSKNKIPLEAAPLRCYRDDASIPSSYSSSSSHEDQQGPQQAVLKAITKISKSEGRIAQTTNVVIGGTVTSDATNEWLALDQKVHSYPMARGFTAIGMGGEDFVSSMVVAVESVLQERIPEGRITQKVSSRGKYVSVNIGPILVISGEQVQAVYNAMRRDDRMKYFL